MKILVACEESQSVTVRLRSLGHTAWSCDIVPCSGGHPEWHLQQDVVPLLEEKWDMVYAFPPCTDLAISGARYFAAKQADGRQQASIEFFMSFTRLYHIPRVVIENPIGIMSTLYRKPDQIIHPWMFGDPESKATCPWLKGVPKIVPTNVLPKPECGYWSNQTPSGQNKLGPSADRAKIRSKTYPGIADAMAKQLTN